MRVINPYWEIIEETDVYAKIERAGRICYKSEDKITSTSSQKFIKNLINRGHESVLEHSNLIFEMPNFSALSIINAVNKLKSSFVQTKIKSNYLKISVTNLTTIISGNIRAWRDFLVDCKKAKILDLGLPSYFYNSWLFSDLSSSIKTNYFDNYEIYVDGLCLKDRSTHLFYKHHNVSIIFCCSRAISHELVRHRAFSFSQESQRYCAYNKDKFSNSVAFIKPNFILYSGFLLENKWQQSIQDAENAYFNLLDLGAKPEEAREVLPNSTKTEVFMTGSLYEWNDFFDLRCAPNAHPEMRRLTIHLHHHFLELGWAKSENYIKN